MDLARLKTWWQDEGRARFLKDASGGWLAERRWFGGKARTVTHLDPIPFAWLRGDDALVLVHLDVSYGDGASERYFVPIHARPMGWSDALASDAGARVLVRLMTGQTSAAPTGSVTGFATNDVIRADLDDLPIHRDLGEQSNTCVRLGDAFILKVFRRLQPGPNPDFEVCRYLSQQAGYRHVPPVWGALECPSPSGEATTLAMLQPWLSNSGNGWSEALDAAREAITRSTSARRGSLGGYRDAIVRLARRTAELHLALAREDAPPTFRPEPLAWNEVDGIRQNVERQLQAASARVPVGGFRSAGLERLTPNLVEGLWKIRCHGDYHLGQVLCVDGDYVLLDFEGEPSRPLAQRRAKHCPLKDVAGMVRSYDYAAMVTWRESPRGERDGLLPLATAWSHAAGEAFVAAYRQRLNDPRLAPVDDEAFTTLLRLFLLEKALFELDYELNNRPDWVDVPLRGLERLVGTA